MSDRCSLCIGHFLPLTFPCGHTICSTCSLFDRVRPGLISQHQCPLCRQRLPRNGAGNRLISPSTETKWDHCAPLSTRFGTERKPKIQVGPMTTSFSTLRRSRIFPTMEKQANRGNRIIQADWGSNAEEMAALKSAQQQTIIRIHPKSTQQQNGSSIRDIAENDERIVNGQIQFRLICDRFERAIGMFNGGEAKTGETVRKAKETICQKEKQLWINSKGQKADNGRAELEKLAKQLLRLAQALEECNRNWGEKEDGCEAEKMRTMLRRTSPWKVNTAQLQLQLLSLLIILAEEQRQLTRRRDWTLFERRISLLGKEKMKKMGRGRGRLVEGGGGKRRDEVEGEEKDGDEQQGEEDGMLDTLISCSRQISSMADGRHVLSSSLLSLIARAQFTLFTAIDAISRRLLRANPTNISWAYRSKVWRIIHKCFVQLLRVGSLSWKSDEVPRERISLVALLAKLVAQFADVCDSSIQMLCMIEVEKARLAIAAEGKINAGEMGEQILLIELDMLECQKVQKMNELRSETQIVRRENKEEELEKEKLRKKKTVRRGGWLTRLLSRMRAKMKPGWK